MLSDGRFWAGVIVGVAVLYAYSRYKVSQAAK